MTRFWVSPFLQVDVIPSLIPSSIAFDIRPLVASLEVGAGKIRLALIQEQGRPGVSPREVLEQVCALAHEDALCARIVRLESGDVGSGLSN